MKTKENDRRVRRTRQILREALINLILEKGYDRITVQDIIDRADVGRSTFYAHFRGKDELLLSGFEEFKNASTAEKRNDERAADKFGFDSLKMFQHAHEHRRIYRALAGRSGGDLFLKQMFRQHHEICLEEFRRAVAPEKRDSIETEAAAHFFAGALTSLLTFWLDRNLPLTPEEMNDLFVNLTMNGVRKTLNLVE